jgi:transcriptional regulator with XRE-family HTH domain
MASFAERFRDMLKELGYTQEEAAKRLGTTQSTISYYATTTRRPRRKTVNEIATKFGIPVSQLLEEDTLRERDPKHSLGEAALGWEAVQVMLDLKKRYKQKPEIRQQVEHMLSALHGSDAKAIIDWLKQ